MGFLTWIGLGLVAGILAKIIIPGKDPGGWIITIILGIGGAFMGGWIGSFAGMGAADGLNLPSIITATGGAIVILLIYRVVFRRG
ncbi:GlsB/YeaQ/YmgE family stress response membrane protein [Luteolibacter algae]|uniref:GlsB/YeaQ/YmgE family stress response membrane protein n=1 Tax=Luteolibacter algae TaxID=454151 RepID=A0ABW5D3P2_9BACT